METFEERLSSTGALADGLRRKLYLFIRGQRRPVGRDEAAQAVGISRKLAAFHLDKLVDKGLLTPRYLRLTGRSGPGAGRPAKVYEPSGREVSVSIPFRSYEVAGDILLSAIESSGSSDTELRKAARARGVDLAEKERRARGRLPTTESGALKVAHDVLAERGYEPYYDEAGGLRLHNCPFHALAQRSPELVCGMNKAFIDGVLEGLGAGRLQALLDRKLGECCVHVRGEESVTSTSRRKRMDS